MNTQSANKKLRKWVLSGKGDTPRPVDLKVYGDNYDRIFQTIPECVMQEICERFHFVEPSYD
jgi:hypothetical protein